MAKKILDKLLHNEWLSPDNGKTITLPPCEVKIQTGLTKLAADIINQYEHKGIVLVCDENTYEVQAKDIESQVRKKGWHRELLKFSGKVEPKIELVNEIKDRAADKDLIVAIGSGTINDLCKYAAFLSDKPYIVFATAPSMNGYSSANASIKIGKYKQTLKAALPKAIYIDLDIFAKSPLRLVRSGAGDMLARPTAQVDWLLSHLLLGTEFQNAPFALLEENEEQLLDNIKGLLNQDIQAFEVLAEGLILSGFGMYIAGSSSPASQGEHMIAHYMEMVYPELKHTYHGEQIGVTTIYMAELQRNLLEKKNLKLGSYNFSKEKLIKQFGEEIGAGAYSELEKKKKVFLESKNAEKANDWGYIRGKLSAITASPEKITGILNDLGAPKTPQELNWPEQYYFDAVKNSFLLRNRFTFLDLDYLSNR